MMQARAQRPAHCWRRRCCNTRCVCGVSTIPTTMIQPVTTPAGSRQVRGRGLLSLACRRSWIWLQRSLLMSVQGQGVCGCMVCPASCVCLCVRRKQEQERGTCLQSHSIRTLSCTHSRTLARARARTHTHTLHATQTGDRNFVQNMRPGLSKKQGKQGNPPPRGRIRSCRRRRQGSRRFNLPGEEDSCFSGTRRECGGRALR